MTDIFKLDSDFVNFAKAKAYKKHCEQIVKAYQEIDDTLAHFTAQPIDITTKHNVYNYITGLFPNINFDGLKIYSVNHLLLSKIGALGLYCPAMKIILYCNSGVILKPHLYHKQDKIIHLQSDEILVHELLHFCDHYLFPDSFSLNNYFEEEFAMGYSLDFFRQQDISDENIVFRKYWTFFDSNFDKVVFETAMRLNDESLDKFYKSTDKQKYVILKRNKKTIDKLKYDLYQEMGVSLIKRYEVKIKQMREINKDGGITREKLTDLEMFEV